MNDPLIEPAQRGAVTGVLAAADKIAANAAAIEEIRELAEHWRWSGAQDGPPKSPPLRQSGMSILGILARHGL